MMLIFTKKEERENRVNLCNVCEFKKQNNSCSLCGCNLFFLQKIKWAKCPSNKWEST
jgi:hypothetical protein